MFQPNSVIAGRYQVVRLVGQGGMSNLYLAHDRKYSNATVVIKEMTASYSDPKEQQMAVDLFHREAKLLASLNHRHIPKVYDYFQFAGKYYLSMEYIDGVDLAVKLEEQKSFLPEAQVLDWGRQIATVLFYLHKHEPPIVFRDVKPSNIMISSNGVKLIDFGIARHFDQAKKGDTMRIGSPGYAPPEQYAAQTDPRSDIYALGVTLHHALTGRDPTATNTPFLVPPARDINPALSEAAAAMLARATQLDPSDRYQSALDMKKDIQAILDGKTDGANIGLAPTQSTGTDAPAPVAAVSAAKNNQPAAQSPPPTTPGTPPQTPPPTVSPSGALPPAPTASGTLGPTPAATGSGKKKRKPSLAGLLLVAGVFLLSAAVAGLATLPKEKREALFLKAKLYSEAIVQEVRSHDAPEAKLRDALLTGSAAELLPLLQSAEFKELSEEKQELFRQNLLAAASKRGPVRVVNLVLPQESDSPDLWRAAGQAVQAVNGNGGIDGSLVAVIPEYYTPGTLSAKLGKILSGEQSLEQHFLVLGAENENLELPEKLADRPLFLGEHPGVSKFVPDLTATSPSLEELFQLKLEDASSPVVWGISGPSPKGAVLGEHPLSPPLTTEALDGLLKQAQDQGGKVTVLAEELGPLDKIQQEGQLEILATTAEQLPSLNERVKADALVLSSPFEERNEAKAHHVHLLGEETLSMRQARIFDALVLASLPDKEAYQGLTLLRGTDGKIQPKHAVTYRWTGKSWLPTPKPEGGKG